MKQTYNRLMIVFLAIFHSGIAQADLITFAFEGEVTSSNKEAVFPLGQSISGQYSFDPSVADSNPGNPEQGTYDAIRAFSFTSGNYTVDATPANSANTGGTITVNRDTVFDPQEYSVFLIRSELQDLWGPDVNGEQLVRMWLKLDGGSQSPIESIELPLTPPDLAAFDSTTFGLFFYSDPTNFEGAGVQFEVTSLTLVPVPSSIVLLCSGFFMLAGFFHKKAKPRIKGDVVNLPQ